MYAAVVPLNPRRVSGLERREIVFGESDPGIRDLKVQDRAELLGVIGAPLSGATLNAQHDLPVALLGFSNGVERVDGRLEQRQKRASIGQPHVCNTSGKVDLHAPLF